MLRCMKPAMAMVSTAVRGLIHVTRLTRSLFDRYSLTSPHTLSTSHNSSSRPPPSSPGSFEVQRRLDRLGAICSIGLARVAG